MLLLMVFVAIWDAAVFLDLTSSLATITADLVARLDRGLAGFAAARQEIAAELAAEPDDDRDGQNSFELQVVWALQRCRKPGRRVRLLVDGLDQPGELSDAGQERWRISMNALP